jgi:glutathione S-transferase
MLTVHHLGKSQSERIVWLCEELAIPYDLKLYKRDATAMLAPPDLRAAHPAGTAPLMTDEGVTIGESAAIMEYILAKYGSGRLVRGPEHPDFATYLYWFHFTNGTLQPHLGRNMILSRTGLPADHAVMVSARSRVDRALAMLEARLTEAPWLAGADFTAADIMLVFTLTTMRYFMPWDLSAYPKILAYLQKISKREAYQRAMAKGDPGMALLLT